MEIDFFQAIGKWFSGNKLDDLDKLCVWSSYLCLKVLWWSRGAKIVQFVSGSLVVIKLVGIEVVQRKLKKIEQFLPRRSKLLEWWELFIHAINLKNIKNNRLRTAIVNVIGFSIIILMMVIIFTLIFPVLDEEILTSPWVGIFFLIFFLGAAYILFLPLISTILFLVLNAFLKMLAYLSKSPKLENGIDIFSFFLFFFSSLLDLLLS